jgi:transposase
MQVTTIGLDIAKNVFQVHGIDANEKVVVRKQLRRGKVMAFFEALSPCLIGMEACATAHHLGARVDEARPQGAADAGEGCKGLP